MKKILLLSFVFLFTASTLMAQQEKKKMTTYMAIDSQIYCVKDTLILGQPSMPNKFRYLYVYLPYGPGAKLAQHPFGDRDRGQQIVISKIKKDSNMLFRFYLVGIKKPSSFMICLLDIDKALKTGEIISKSKKYRPQ